MAEEVTPFVRVGLLGGQVCQCGTLWWGQWQRVAEDSGPPHVTWTPACPSAGQAWARGALAAAFRLCLGLGLGARGALSAAACGQSGLRTARGRKSPHALRVSLGSSQVCSEGGQHVVPALGPPGPQRGSKQRRLAPGSGRLPLPSRSSFSSPHAAPCRWLLPPKVACWFGAALRVWGPEPHVTALALAFCCTRGLHECPCTRGFAHTGLLRADS